MMPYPFLRAIALAIILVCAPPIGAQVREDEMAVGPNIEKEDFFRVGIAPVRTPVGYDLTIVYFMDYQCPSCRRYTPDVARVLGEDKRVRVIYRDTPIISDLSTVAARAAIAASFQGRHEAFHHALMMQKGRLTEGAIRTAADSAKIDWALLQRDLKSRGEEIDLQIGRNVELAVITGIMGTPAFIVGDRLSNGALDYASLKAEIADARAAGGSKVGAGALPQAEAETKASAPATSNAPELTREATASVPPSSPMLHTRATANNESVNQTKPLDRNLPWPLLAGIAVIGAIGGTWLVQRRKNRDR